MVIDVLCHYLRMPHTPAPGPLPEDASAEQAQAHHERELEFAALREVRHTIIRIIGRHLRNDTRWRGKNYDFTGAVFDGGNLAGAHFTGGLVDFSNAKFAGGSVDFIGAKFTGAYVAFTKAEFADGTVNLGAAEFSGGTVDFANAEFTGCTVRFFGARFTDGEVDFGSASGVCPEGLLDAVEIGEPGVVVLPQEAMRRRD